jgi:hypothetical protein
MANRIFHIEEDGSKSWLSDYDHETGGVKSIDHLRECAEVLEATAVQIDAGEFDAGELDAGDYRSLAADYRALIAMREPGCTEE